MFKIGFLEITPLDIVDILLVAALIFYLYRLLKGTIAFNILVGFIFIYLVAKVVKTLGMSLLSTILGQFVGVGMIALLIIFQQEIRKFLLILGQTNPLSTSRMTFSNFLPWKWKTNQSLKLNYNEIIEACIELKKTGTGALIVISKSTDLQQYITTGFFIDANIHDRLIQNIFFKNSPMHDGAIIIARNKIKAASCILPVSGNLSLPDHLGLRHRAAVGLSEQSDAIVIVVSEEKGTISIAYQGEILYDITEQTLREILEKSFI